MRVDPVRNLPSSIPKNNLNEKLNSKNVKNMTENFSKVLSGAKLKNKDKIKKVTEWVSNLSDLRENLKNETTKDNLTKYKDSLQQFLDY